MLQLTEDILQFLCNSGITASPCTFDGINMLKVSCIDAEHMILPLNICAATPEEAISHSEAVRKLVARLGNYPLIIPEDRWRTQKQMMKSRLLAHLGTFTPAYARNCEVRRIDKKDAADFLESAHSYGDAACRYRYGLFLKRHTGGRAHIGKGVIDPGTLIAVATFSNARKWQKGEKSIRSYEWTRYASLPGVRINGGMGKLLQAFIDEADPDDIMSYADLEWSEGHVYEQLGFSLEGRKEAVVFSIDSLWRRHPMKPENGTYTHHSGDGQEHLHSDLFFCNFGSNKYRLKLTEYE